MVAIFAIQARIAIGVFIWNIIQVYMSVFTYWPRRCVFSHKNFDQYSKLKLTALFRAGFSIRNPLVSQLYSEFSHVRDESGEKHRRIEVPILHKMMSFKRKHCGAECNGPEIDRVKWQTLISNHSSVQWFEAIIGNCVWLKLLYSGQKRIRNAHNPAFPQIRGERMIVEKWNNSIGVLAKLSCARSPAPIIENSRASQNLPVNYTSKGSCCPK